MDQHVYWGQSDPRVIPPGAEQASDDTNLKSGDLRLTTQMGKTRLTGAYSNGPRWRRHFGIENRGGSPESFAQYPNDSSVTQVKATTTLSNNMLFEAGFSRIWWYAVLEKQPVTVKATYAAWGDLRRSPTDPAPGPVAVYLARVPMHAYTRRPVGRAG